MDYTYKGYADFEKSFDFGNELTKYLFWVRLVGETVDISVRCGAQ